MEKLAIWIVTHKKQLICIIILLIALSIIGAFFVKKNGDVISYLDKDSEPILGKTLLENEFGIIGDASVAISYLQKNDVTKIVKEIIKNSKIKPYIKTIVWDGTFDALDDIKTLLPDGDKIDADDILQVQKKAKEKFVKKTQVDNSEVSTYIISVYFNTSNSEKVIISALDKIDEIITNYVEIGVKNNKFDTNITESSQFYYIGGNAQNARALVKSSLGDMPIFIAVAVAICFIILLLTTKSYIEPIIFLATLGVSILLNMGSNLIAGLPVGTISSITSTCSIILQLALAMDYSIFFMHTYYEEQKHTLNNRKAIVNAMPKTILSISSSALTTVGGFVALFFMQYKMGYDLGFVLAKGVLLSLLSVIFIQPLLIMMLDKPIEKCKHTWQLECHMRTAAKVVTKPWVAIIIIVICLGIGIPSAYYQTQVPLNYITMNKENPNPNLPEQILKSSSNQVILLVPFDKNAPDDAINKQLEFIAALKLIGNKTNENSEFIKDAQGNYINDDNICNVTDVFSLFAVVDKDFYNTIETMSSFSKTMIYSRLHSSFISNMNKNGAQSYMLYTVDLTGTPEDTSSYATVNELNKLCDSFFGEGSSRITGLTVGAKELARITPRDFLVVNLVSALLILIILLFTFRKAILSFILLLVIETGIFVNLALVLALGSIMPTVFNTQINFLAYLIVSAIELGATVDYAIIFTSKYLDEKKHGVKSQVAIKNAIYRSAPSVLTSASILIFICFTIRFITTNMIVGQITELIARGALFSTILVFTLLPAILSLSEKAKRYIAIKRGKPDPDLDKNDTCLFDLPYKKHSFRRKSK